ncbi:MAG TPA: 1,4-alpha-glucan branching protein GlgB [Abditibacteriaceae bacterium]
MAWFSDLDLHLFAEGTHERVYERMGAHLATINGQKGVHFAVWAPNARAVWLMGEFNGWNQSSHPLNANPSGIWTLFMPGLEEHSVYKYRVQGASGESYDKADPYGFAMEQRPRTASVVTNLDSYQWNDADWISNRPVKQAFDQPLSVYEVHLGSWRKKPDEEWGSRYLTYREFADELIPYVKQMGFTHIELLPITEHPLDASWGYQVMGFYAATSRFGTPQELMYFIDQCHQNDIGVILDWVPAHFPKDGSGLNYFDGTHLYSHADPRQGEHVDWGTLIFNYDRNEVRSFLLSNAMFWLEKFHFDGLRVDAVASMLYLNYSREDSDWVPNIYGGHENLGAISFLRKVNEAVHGVFPGALTIAEESTSWPMVTMPTYLGGLGFSMKWNMGWMNDSLHYMEYEPIHRRWHQSEMTFSLIYAFSENFVLPLSHDEVVHLKGSLLNKMPGDEWQKFANLRAYLAFMWAHPGKKLLFMGGEIAQWQEWAFEGSIEWDALVAPGHQGVQSLVSELNRLLKSEAALHEEDFHHNGFEWIDGSDVEGSVLAFMRHAKDKRESVVIINHFTPIVRQGYRIGVPQVGFYQEILNTDSSLYWGSNAGNNGGVQAEETPWHGQPYSIVVTLPPLATLLFKKQEN